MEQFGKPIVILSFTALGVVINLVFSSFYDDALDIESIWFVPPITASVSKSGADAGDTDARTYIAANVGVLRCRGAGCPVSLKLDE